MNTEIILRISSQIVASNIDDVAESVRAEIAKVNTDLKTDEDFAIAEQQVKDFKAAEDAFKAALDAALAEAADVKKLMDTTSEIIDLLAKTRLALDKQVKAQKAKVKEEIIGTARDGIHRSMRSTLRIACNRRCAKCCALTSWTVCLPKRPKAKKHLPDWRRAAPKSWRTGRR